MTRPRARLLIVLLAVLTLAVPTALYLREFAAIDRCLDAGGVMNYERFACERDVPRGRFVPFSSRHRGLLIGSGAIIGLLIFAGAMVATAGPRRTA